ncbi:hypothetical protein SAMN04489712_109225 [Thermomonospora echinospora]|uniref:Uncharacterized protein n=1 Tax=Thermomonospora echinospora TaxID=1992 RepID=A0A1H6CD72_9ACTN|nr:DUF6069 family protein [Thermomonospora echinospora]SEG70959.1 hypothetical protein SAMN04489712_109225 [Thermomonospora echinospora]
MTTVTAAQTVQTAPSQPARRRARLTAVGSAVLVNSVLYVAGRLAGVDFKLTAPGTVEPHQLILPEIIAFTLLFGLLGWGALAALERLTRRAHAIWAVLATTVLVVSFAPIWIEHATSSTRAMLVVLHLVVATALFPLLRQGPGVPAK